jgi:hypothetical protein
MNEAELLGAADVHDYTKAYFAWGNAGITRD